MTRRKLLWWMKKSPTNRYIVGFCTVFVSLTLLMLFMLYPVRIVFYGMASGNYLLNVENIQTETKVEQDDPLSVTFCREPRSRIVAVNNVRTFYLTEENKPVFERRLPDGVVYEQTGNKCVPLSIRIDQRPNALGHYRFCQEFDFYTEFDQKKTAHFCSNEYEVVEPTRDEVPPETLDIN